MASNSDTGDQGFASMDEDKQRDIASKGGKTQHKGDGSSSNSSSSSGSGNSGNFADDKAKAQEAGRKGGQHSGTSKN